MADFLFPRRQHRHPLVVLRQLFRTDIDIHYLDIEIMLAAYLIQCSEHVLAKVAIASAIEGQDRLTYPALP